MERLETKHWSCDPSDETVIRPNDIIGIFGLNNTDDPTNVGEFEDDIKPLLPQILSAESLLLSNFKMQGLGQIPAEFFNDSVPN